MKKIYVADLAAYNNGKLHGVWINAAQDMENIQDEINIMLAQSPIDNAEEWAIHDYEGFETVSLSEHEGLKSANEKALFIEEHGLLGAELLNYYSDIEDTEKMLEDNYNGKYESVADYAEQLTEETSEIPKHLEFYIDYEKMGRDMEMSGDIFTIETAHNEVHVFWNH